MAVIKRYSNRKLYDTESKHYVTLEDLAQAIRHGEEVQVVDHNTGEDLTSLTLLQVIFEEEKKIGGLLPSIFFTRLIRAGDSTVNAVRSRLLAIDPFQVIDDEIRRRIQMLVSQGRVTEEEARRFEDLLLRKAAPKSDAVVIPVKGEEETTPVDDSGDGSNPVPADQEAADMAEVEALARQVALLEEQLARLKASNPPAA